MNFSSSLVKIAVFGLATAQAEEFGIVWLHGAGIAPEAYQTIAEAVQDRAVERDQKVFFSIPDFELDLAAPFIDASIVADAFDQLKEAGFTGDKVILAGHNAGALAAQQYISTDSSLVYASIMMGATLDHSVYSIVEDGTSSVTYPVPTLTLGGEKDGVNRITHTSVAFWHQVKNIEQSG